MSCIISICSNYNVLILYMKGKNVTLEYAQGCPGISARGRNVTLPCAFVPIFL